jgi:hypothetical protein
VVDRRLARGVGDAIERAVGAEAGAEHVLGRRHGHALDAVAKDLVQRLRLALVVQDRSDARGIDVLDVLGIEPPIWNESEQGVSLGRYCKPNCAEFVDLKRTPPGIKKLEHFR